MGDDRQPCGTPAAYQRHLRHGEEPCRECRAANAEASRRRRASGAPMSEHTRESSRRYQRARQRALARLAAAHPEEYAALLADERGGTHD